jgi:lipopolysaccharide export LptBFGC system permease protein LptF
MPGEQFIKELFSKAVVEGSKSTVLKPLGGVLGALFGLVALSAYLRFSLWLLILFVILTCISFILFLWAFVYCLIKSPESLRSEKYSIQKMAIEKGIIGDNITGQLSNNEKNKIDMYEAGSVDSEEEKNK